MPLTIGEAVVEEDHTSQLQHLVMGAQELEAVVQMDLQE